jgi:hypothetical protein
MRRFSIQINHFRDLLGCDSSPIGGRRHGIVPGFLKTDRSDMGSELAEIVPLLPQSCQAIFSSLAFWMARKRWP